MEQLTPKDSPVGTLSQLLDEGPRLLEDAGVSCCSEGGKGGYHALYVVSGLEQLPWSVVHDESRVQRWIQERNAA